MSENAVKTPRKRARRRKKKATMLRLVCKRLVRNKVAMLGLIIIVLVLLASICAPLIAPYGLNEMDYTALSAPPSLKHIMGCDHFGRDIFTRILYGGRWSLALGLISAMIIMIIGVFFGCLAGYLGGIVDNIAMRICDIWSAIPGMLFAIIISAALGGGFFNTILAMLVGGIPGCTRGNRAVSLKEREMEYLDAARAMNCSKLKIVFKHMMPNVIAPTIVGTTGQIGGIMMQAASLSYIGLGIQQPTPEWGAMCSSARKYILTYPHMIIWPGVAILITVLAFNMFGDGLRDAMDPKLND